MSIQRSDLSLRRRREIAGLPQEHKAFFSHQSRNLVTKIEDTLLALGREERIATGRRYVPKEVTYPALPDNVELTEDLTARLCVLGLYPLYAQDITLAGSDPEFNAYLSCSMTLMSAFANNADIQDVGLNRAFYEYILNLVLEVITPEELVRRSDLIWPLLQDLARLQEWVESRGIIIIIALSVFLLISKRLVANSVVRWFANRWRALAQVLAKKLSIEPIERPQLESCLAFNTAISSKHQIRASMFRLYRRLALMPMGTYRNVFAVVCKQLEFSEMPHIYMILENIYKYHPDILSMSELMGTERSAMTRALEFLGTLPEEDRPFAKILHPHSHTAALDSKHFTMFTVAARAVASVYTPSMEQYRIRDNDALIAFAKKVTDHVRNKSRISLISASEAAGKLIGTE